MTHPIALAHLTLIELAPPQLIEAAAQVGIERVSVRIAPASAGELVAPMLGGAPMMRETLARMRDLNVAVNDVEIILLKGDTDVPALEPVVAAAAELGARHILVAGDDADEAALAQRFAQLCELGARYGICMGLEFMPWRGIKTLASARRVVQAAGAGGIIVDAIHLHRSGGTVEELTQLPAKELAFFQICDAPAKIPDTQEELLFQARRARLPPGKGGLDLVGMVRALPPDAVVSIENPLHGLPDLLPPVPRVRMLREATQQVLEQARGK